MVHLLKGIVHHDYAHDYITHEFQHKNFLMEFPPFFIVKSNLGKTWGEEGGGGDRGRLFHNLFVNVFRHE